MGLRVLWGPWTYEIPPMGKSVQVNLTLESEFWIPSLIPNGAPDTISNLSSSRELQNVGSTRTTRDYLVPLCHSIDEDSEAQRETNLLETKS